MRQGEKGGGVIKLEKWGDVAYGWSLGPLAKIYRRLQWMVPNFVFISVYVDIGTEASGTATLAFAFDGASTNRKYDIKVAQIPCGTSYA